MGQINGKSKQVGVNTLFLIQVNEDGSIVLINQEIYTTSLPRWIPRKD